MSKMSQAKKEKKRAPETFPILPSETVIADDHFVNADFVYICDGIFTRCPYYGDPYYGETTVADWKRRDGIREIRRCDLFARKEARIGDRVEFPNNEDSKGVEKKK